MTISQLALIGDSQTQGTYLGYAYSAGGQGSWFEMLRDRLANISGIGPLISSGFRTVGLDIASNVEWTFTTGGAAWTTTVSTDAIDKNPYGQACYANGAAAIATYTIPQHQRTNVGFAIYYIDFSSGGNWQYRVDGGTWTNMGQTRAGNNGLAKFYVSTPVTSTVDIRASSDATTGVNCVLSGIEIFYASPTSTQGLIVHNLGLDGRQLHQLALASSGDRMAWFDSVTLRNGAITNSPAAGIVLMQMTNDCHQINNASTYATDLTTVQTRLAPIAPLLFLNPWEYQLESSQQATYRAQTKTTCAGFSPAVPVLDLYDAWSGNGIAGYSQANTAGLMGDGTHESQLGHYDIARRVYWQVRNRFFSSLSSAPSALTAAAKQSSVAYVGKSSAVAYSAGAPVTLAAA